MGYARIISGGADGRYRIELDYGEATRQGLVTAISGVIATIDAALNSLAVRIAEAEAKEAELVEQVRIAEQALIDATGPERPGGSPKPDTSGYRFATKRLSDLRSQNEPLRIRRAALQHQRSIAVNRLATWTAFVATEQRDAWCADLTEDAAPGSYAATVDIPGESSLALLAPGCRVWAPADGVMTAREIMSPEQAFLNAAILPGWQKFKPTYRWGTITGINYENDTADVSLAAAVSSARRLGVNQAVSLAGVPVTYMDCNAQAFEVGDRVVVQFVGQDWASPRVIGFLDNPKPCAGWQILLVGLSSFGAAGPFRYLSAVFRTLSPDYKFEEAMGSAGTVEADFRVGRGDWTPLIGISSGPITAGVDWTNALNSGGHIIGGLIVTLVFPGSYPLPDGSAFTGAPGQPAHLRVGFLVNSGFAPDNAFAPLLPLGAVVEVRIRIDGLVFANVAVRSSFAPFAVDSGAQIPSSAINVESLDYVRFVEDGT
jgi:hypothetical protein